MSLPILHATDDKRITFFERLKARMRPKPHPVCANCGSTLFTTHFETDGKLAAYCLMCHTLNIFQTRTTKGK